METSERKVGKSEHFPQRAPFPPTGILPITTPRVLCNECYKFTALLVQLWVNLAHTIPLSRPGVVGKAPIQCMMSGALAGIFLKPSHNPFPPPAGYRLLGCRGITGGRENSNARCRVPFDSLHRPLETRSERMHFFLSLFSTAGANALTKPAVVGGRRCCTYWVQRKPCS